MRWPGYFSHDAWRSLRRIPRQHTNDFSADDTPTSLTAGRPYAAWIRQEIYREWLIPLIREKHVILITARKSRYSKPALARIHHVLDWLPQECYFNTEGLRPDVCKRRILHETVFPRHGTPARARYLALESNAVTRRMYAREGITAVRVPDCTTWASLPAIPEI